MAFLYTMAWFLAGCCGLAIGTLCLIENARVR